ncbi:MAG: 3-(methylthio)propionyl---CoA ligase [Candidatus Eremiobacteraeota bacterium]|jgi:fatty-acyl-CoA synthase|nr:3-(methylthio)propionyl---CoA ligase [Candidatus Eremiobacteraeota bacterium]
MTAPALAGLMMDRSLQISRLIDHAAQWHGDVEIVTLRTGLPDLRGTYRELRARSAQLAHALSQKLHVVPGDRVATFAWNSQRHLELYYGVSGSGAVLHTVNPRLFAAQIEYVVNHARDRFVFVDADLVPVLEPLAARLPHVEGYVVLCDEAALPATSLPNAVAYESLLAGLPEDIEWPELDERTASSLCYTSGTTGNPKGVLYSHRSTLLHSFAQAASWQAGPGSQAAVLPVVPLFHANAWGLPYVAPMQGSKLVFADPHLDAAALYEAFEREQITLTCGVPTIWLRLLEYLERNDLRFSSLKLLAVGGAAPPRAMIEAFELKYGVCVMNAWGMTETSPACTVGQPKPQHDLLPQRIDYKMRAGRCLFGVEMRIVDDDGTPLPLDGVAQGEIHVRGPWIASSYFEDDAATALGITADGWLRTGDIATVDADGYVMIRDRTKDVIKSGGEWISSIDLENVAVAHPSVAEAAAIGVPHPTWSERPVLFVVAKQGHALDGASVLAFLDGKVAKWWLPDEIVVVAELPHTATGKVSKRTLRERYAEAVAQA